MKVKSLKAHASTLLHPTELSHLCAHCESLKQTQPKASPMSQR